MVAFSRVRADDLPEVGSALQSVRIDAPKNVAVQLTELKIRSTASSDGFPDHGELVQA